MTRWILFAALLVAGCRKAPSEDQCNDLLDHLVDLEFKKAGASATNEAMKAEIGKQKQAVSDAKSSDFMKACTEKTARSRVEYAIGASDIDAVAKCDGAN
jgi:hypothetical protein